MTAGAGPEFPAPEAAAHVATGKLVVSWADNCLSTLTWLSVTACCCPVRLLLAWANVAAAAAAAVCCCSGDEAAKVRAFKEVRETAAAWSWGGWGGGRHRGFE